MAKEVGRAVGDAEVELREGFTDKVMLAILFSSLLMTPAFSWVSLSTGVGVGGIAAAYVVMVIFGELSRFFRSPMTESELATIRWGASLAVGGAAGIAWRVFMRKSAITRQFGIADKIPWWWVPPANSPALVQRTIFHPDWLVPLTIGYIGMPFSIIATISLSFVIRQLYMEVERLPFPTGAMAAELAKSMAQGSEPKRYEIFSIAAFIAFLYGIAYYVSPAILMVIGGYERPRGFMPSIIDLTSFLDYSPLYGATFGITIDLMAVSIGMIIPRNVVFGIAIGAVAAYIIGNHYLVASGLIRWKPGTPMIGPGLTGVWQQPMLEYWISVSIGLLVSAIIIPFIKNARAIVEALQSFMQLSAEEERRLGVWSGKKSLAYFFASSAVLVALAIGFELAVNPEDFFNFMPFWLLGVPLITIGLSFVNSLSIGRSTGLMGSSLTIPYSRELVTWALYNGIDGWFNPFISMIDGGTILIGYKAAELTYTKPMSIVKAHVVDTIVSSLSSLFFSYLFWATYDIPSRILPAPGFYSQAALTSLYITKQFGFFKPELIVAGLVSGAVIELVAPISALISAIGLSSGFSSLPSASMAILLGWLIREFIRRKKGDEWVSQYLMSMVAGLWAGSSLAIALSTGITFAYQAVMPGIY